MNQENKQWWRGSLPSWVGTILMSLLVWIIIRFVSEHDRLIKDHNQHTLQISLLQIASDNHREQLIELKEINKKVTEQLEYLRRSVHGEK